MNGRKRIVLGMLSLSLVVHAQSSAPVAGSSVQQLAILGHLEDGNYANSVLGFELRLDPNCAFYNESEAVAYSTQLPQRLRLTIQCGDTRILLSSFPLHSDEKVNLKGDADVSVSGVVDGGGFKRLGHWQHRDFGKTDVLVQELSRHGGAGPESAFYYAFMIGRRYISILAVGPESNKTTLGQTLTKLTIDQPPVN